MIFAQNLNKKNNLQKMCHNSGMQSEQIEKFMAHGMPQKIVKTVEYTMRKRAAEHRKTAANTEPQSSPLPDDDFAEEQKQEQKSSIAACTCAASNTNANTAAAVTATTVNALVATTNTLQPKITSPNELQQKHPENGSGALKIPKLCGRFRQLKHKTEELITNLSGDIDLSSHAAASSSGSSVGGGNSSHTSANGHGTSAAKATPEVYVDVLAVGTQLTKQFAERLSRAVMKMQRSKICTLLTRTAQPAHFIAICILSVVLLAVGPELIENTSSSAISKSPNAAARKHTTLAAIAYLGAFSTHFGAQIWMTFVSGLSLYFSLPRHTFGQCQQILFPKYFALNSVLSIGMLILFVKYFLSPWSLAACVQLVALAVTAFIEVSVRLYLAPPMLRLMHEKYRIEGAIGSGQEVGSLVQGDLVQCPHYQRIHKAFRRIHITVAMGNMAVLLATILHLYFLASKIQIA